MRYARKGMIVAAAALSLATLSLAGCATPGPVLTESVGTMRTGVGVAREQTVTVFDDIEETARDLSIKRKLADTRRSLRETDFPFAIGAETRGRWMNGFDVFDRYLGALQKLVDPARADRTATELNGLATELQDGPAAIKLPDGTGQAFATFGKALVQVTAERKALAAMKKADPAIQAVFAAMADSIGTTNDTDLRGTVWAHWTTQMGEVTMAYIALDPSATDERKTLIEQFLLLRTKRDAEIDRLVQLRTSLLALAEAHAAAARGDAGTALFWIGRIDGWLKEAKKSVEPAQ